MMDLLIWVVLGFFIIVSILDWKFKAIPSILMTGMLFVVAFINIKNLGFGVLALIIAVILQELDESRGMADTKATIIIGFMIPTASMFLLYVGLLVVFQLVYTIGFKIAFPKMKEFPFLPVYALVYAILLIIGRLIV